MNKTIHKAESRGYFDYGWLRTFHSFSFGNYYAADRMNFGKLRVLNDDTVSSGNGFGRHRHENMEIVSIPLKGALAHKDSEGHEEAINPNEVQVMSAGTGIWHSEYNHSETDEVSFLQIWILPDAEGHPPRYDQKEFDPLQRQNRFQTVVSPEKGNGNLWLNQDAYLSLGDFEGGKPVTYQLQSKGNGVYLFVISGDLIEIDDEQLNRRDGIGISKANDITIIPQSPCKLLTIEVPM